MKYSVKLNKTKKINKLKKSYKLKKSKKNKTIKKKQKAGCDWGFFNSDDVLERRNGIRSGRLYNILQFYKFIDRETCSQMEKLGNKLKSKSDNITVNGLKTVTLGALNTHLTNYTLYDNTSSIINKYSKNTPDSSSFIIGLVKIENDEVVFYQAEKDKKKDENLTFSISLSHSIDVIIDINNKEIYFFKPEDAKWSILKPGLMKPSNFIKKQQVALKATRKATESQQTNLTQNETKQQKIQFGPGNKVNTVKK
jgi:hypothetical protein